MPMAQKKRKIRAKDSSIVRMNAIERPVANALLPVANAMMAAMPTSSTPPQKSRVGSNSRSSIARKKSTNGVNPTNNPRTAPGIFEGSFSSGSVSAKGDSAAKITPLIGLKATLVASGRASLSQ